jgi:hypothetical protein
MECSTNFAACNRCRGCQLSVLCLAHNPVLSHGLSSLLFPDLLMAFILTEKPTDLVLRKIQQLKLKALDAPDVRCEVSSARVVDAGFIGFRCRRRWRWSIERSKNLSDALRWIMHR